MSPLIHSLQLKTLLSFIEFAELQLDAQGNILMKETHEDGWQMVCLWSEKGAPELWLNPVL